MKRIPFIFILLLLSVLFACSPSDNDDASSEYVIEGWIESDSHPIVKLTYSIPVTKDYRSLEDLKQYVARWERITISDGEQTATLTGVMDSRFMPPYVYTTTKIRGKAGRTYKLTLHQEGGKPNIEAVTTVPEPVGIDSFHIERVSSSDTLCQLFAYVNIPKTPVTYYKVFAKTDSTSQDFLSSYFGLLRSDMIPDNGKIAIHRGYTNLEKDFTPYFAVGDTVLVRFARIDSTAYEYWRSYDDIIMLARNTLFPVTTSMPKSIPAAYGFWQGMGSRHYMVPIQP